MELLRAFYLKTEMTKTLSYVVHFKISLVLAKFNMFLVKGNTYKLKNLSSISNFSLSFFDPLMPGGSSRSYVLKQTCSF